VAAVAVLAVDGSTEARPSAPHRARALWGGTEQPPDLVQEPEPDVGTDIDAGARAFADVDHPGPVGGDGCAVVAVPPGATVGFFITGGETLPTTFTEGSLCDLVGGAQELRLLGDTWSQDRSTVVGWAEAHFHRTSSAAAFSRFEMDLTDGRCFTIGSLSGYPGDGSAPDDYVIQGWNLGADPAVDCRSRTVAPPTTSTTATAPTAAPTTSGVPTTAPSGPSVPSAGGGAGATDPPAATAVTGAARYAG
jgi:hypothetical protein